MPSGAPSASDARLAHVPLASLLRRATTRARFHMGERMAQEQWAIDAGFRVGCVGALATIGSLQPVSQRDVSEAAGIDPSDLVGLLDVLEDGGLVARERDPEDRRRNLLRLTDDGERAHARLLEVIDAAMADTLAPLDEGERALLLDLLARVADAEPGADEPPRPPRG